MERNKSSLPATTGSNCTRNNRSLSAQQKQQQSVSTTGCHCNKTRQLPVSVMTPRDAASRPRTTITDISSTPPRKINEYHKTLSPAVRRACVRCIGLRHTHAHKSSTLSGCETWSLTLREPNKMEATEHGVNKIFGRKRPVQEDNGDKYPNRYRYNL